MRPSFYPRTVNGPFDDPGVFIPFLFEKRAIIFDLGDIYSLSAKDILKISHVFITHTHIDHFVGFDRLLRLLLGREKELYLYGPGGFLKNVEGKLAGYSWNLVGNYTNRFALHVTEIHPDIMISREYLCHEEFRPNREMKQPFSDVLLKEPALSLSAIILDHGIPCLGFSMKERFHVNIVKESIDRLGLGLGPWLREFKQALFDRQNLDSEFEVRYGKNSTKKFTLGELAEQIAIVSPGQKVTYITDVRYSTSDAEKIAAFAANSDYLFIESAFLEKDKDIAREKCHLTAWQAGTIAGKAKVKQFILFHFSPRYTGMEHFFHEEAQAGYQSFDV